MTGRITGLILICVGLAVLLVFGLWLFSGLAQGRLSLPAMILGFGLLLVILVLPLVGTGAFLFIKGQREARELLELERERQILGMVQAKGQVRVAEVALELRLTRDQVRRYIYSLVDKGLFTGYINWDEGVLYSKQASELRTNRCPNCGGELALAGKGVIRCPYCGTEVFL